MKKYFSLCLMLLFVLSGCSEKILFAKTIPEQAEASPEELPDSNADSGDKEQENVEKQALDNSKPEKGEALGEDEKPEENNSDSIQVVFNPESIPVLVNKQNILPESYHPKDLVTTDIPFITGVTNEKRKMRKEAAEAIIELFSGAKAQGISLLGVSAYRSHATQTALFNDYVSRDGYEKARTYSALPGTSEHETGLSIDVTGGNGACAAEDCFGGTKEAVWLEEYAAEYGFIIRYPKGKESITGYQYEPWHLRYVGKEIALEIMSAGITLEEYVNEKPVNN
jgi:zinc D-Ala-D-Ala carboxypeptidase